MKNLTERLTAQRMADLELRVRTLESAVLTCDQRIRELELLWLKLDDRINKGKDRNDQ